ncbi:NADPH-dependent F420 reductase [Streptomyces sp. SCSIO ZS0520]|uniref:NADPH-dependent F420 reductase n=1 Tax=Streptomyces sp. SCSIO ZS0520 TaxID=2892996 RepID=UPI0021D9618A|nr:NAD(P)-binding domain-containing protein [Streptomyces sp. SCSIO ZS0520]
MHLTLLGTGTMAEALGTPWARAGHELTVLGRDPGKASALARRLGEPTAGSRPPVAHGPLTEAGPFGDAVLLAVPAASAPGVLAAVGAGAGTLRGRTLIDCTNDLGPGFTLGTTGSPSMAERLAAEAPGAQVVKAFNLCHADVWRLTPPVFAGRALSVPLCGDEPEAVARVAALVRDLGCTPVDGGGLVRARLLEATAAFVIGLWVGAGADAQAILPPVEFGGG